MTRPTDEPLYPRRTQADRRRDVMRLLMEHPEFSDRRIAWIGVVGRELVREIRRELVRACRIASRHALSRIGADGKLYKRLPQPRSAGGAHKKPPGGTLTDYPGGTAARADPVRLSSSILPDDREPNQDSTQSPIG
jgi:hypothetical protein